MGFWRGVLNVVGSVPVLGHATAGIQWLAGDKDGAQKSLASSTGNLVGTIGAVGGFMCGGPPGAIAGGAAGSAIGGQIERKINGQDMDLSLKKLGTDATIGGLSGMLGGGGLNALGNTVSSSFGKAALGSSAKTIIATSGGQIIQ
jgi:hypothetical protein